MNNTHKSFWGIFSIQISYKQSFIASDRDIEIKSNRRAFNLVTNIQDEVHRFAISYHKKLQSKKLLSRELTEIKGIGKQKADNLLKTFKTISKIKQASREELLAVKGINQQNADEIIQYFNK